MNKPGERKPSRTRHRCMVLIIAALVPGRVSRQLLRKTPAEDANGALLLGLNFEGEGLRTDNEESNGLI